MALLSLRGVSSTSNEWDRIKGKRSILSTVFLLIFLFSFSPLDLTFPTRAHLSCCFVNWKRVSRKRKMEFLQLVKFSPVFFKVSRRLKTLPRLKELFVWRERERIQTNCANVLLLDKERLNICAVSFYRRLDPKSIESCGGRHVGSMLINQENEENEMHLLCYRHAKWWHSNIKKKDSP